MDAGQALAELTEISSQIELAVIFDPGGELVASTLTDREAAERLARGGAELFVVASRGSQERGEPAQIELALLPASILLARQGDLRILAVAGADAVAGLAFFDLGVCLRRLAGAEPRKRRLRVLRNESPPAGRDEGGAA
jgi:predicted regulator of Ras-like GTPase activity (Roadblock/LC7/MglB family)